MILQKLFFVFSHCNKKRSICIWCVSNIAWDTIYCNKLHHQYLIHWINLFLKKKKKKKINIIISSVLCNKCKRDFLNSQSCTFVNCGDEVKFSKKLLKVLFKSWAYHFWFSANIYLLKANCRSTRYQNDFLNIVLVSLLLILNIFHNFSTVSLLTLNR